MLLSSGVSGRVRFKLELACITVGSTGTARTIADGRYGSTTFTTTGRDPSVIVDPAAIAAEVVVVVGRGLCCGGGSCCVPVPANADLVTAPTVRRRFGDIGSELLLPVPVLCSTQLVLLMAVLLLLLLLLLLTLIAGEGRIRLVPPTVAVAVVGSITTAAFVDEPTE